MDQLPSYLTISDQPSEVLKSLIEKWKPDLVAILVDENTKNSCLPKLTIENPLVVEIKSGEENKNLITCENIWSALTEHKFTRKSLLVNLGGGVIGDMGGFVASTFKRGIKFVNIPTTLLSQVDASIGGKLGVDFNHLKNHIGLFKDPDHVIVNPDFLETLNTREFKSGFGEVIKHALIHDKPQWEILRASTFENQNWQELIPKSIAIKNAVVSEDPTENGIRKILNFGHTIGHAIESHFLLTPDKLLHGEAIAVGMIVEGHLSLQKGWLTEAEFSEISDFIVSSFTLPNSLPDMNSIADYLLQDKKNDSRGINFSLLNGIGKCEFDVSVSPEMIKKSLTAYS